MAGAPVLPARCPRCGETRTTARFFPAVWYEPAHTRWTCKRCGQVWKEPEGLNPAAPNPTARGTQASGAQGYVGLEDLLERWSPPPSRSAGLWGRWSRWWQLRRRAWRLRGDRWVRAELGRIELAEDLVAYLWPEAGETVERRPGT